MGAVSLFAGLVGLAPSTAHAASGGNGCGATLTGTFLQPSYSVFAWSATRYQQELGNMRTVGIRNVIDQWTVDMDANQAYYPDPVTWYPEYADMVGALLSAARSNQMGVWLGLGNVYAWQAHAGDYQFLSNQLYVDERTADQLWARYPGQVAGWYVSNEVDDGLLANPSLVAPMTWFFSSLAAYLHTHDGDLKVMTSPTYSGLHESTAAFASSAQAVMGSLDVLNVQDGGGSGYIRAANISDWFSALSAALYGTGTALWQDADMYSPGGPMAPATLQSDLQATCGDAAARTGFSFSTQMDPLDLKTSYFYNAYKNYVSSL
ncbi:MAG: DUF4434 domain-containing protein [Acidimicrobiales bacterium]